MKINSSAELKALKGRHVTKSLTGLMVTGTIIATSEDQHSYNITVRHQEVNWGGQTFTTSHSFQRKCDGWGSMNHVEFVD